jgi:hypothetical protein
MTRGRPPGPRYKDPQAAQWWCKYGLTRAQVEQMRIDQDYKCMICQQDMGPKPCIDHIAGTKVVRALLCYACNTALGKFRDSPRLLIRAIRYIQWHNAQAAISQSN